MLRFYAGTYGTVITHINHLIWSVDSPDFEQIAEEFMSDPQWILGDLPLSRVTRAHYGRLQKQFRLGAPRDRIAFMLTEMHNNIIVDLTDCYFLCIKSERRGFYEQPKPLFGPDVQNMFPKAGLDIASAGRCFALNEWTACVFHLMRALEHGLRWLGSDVGLDPAAVATDNWKNVIDQIEKEIRRLEQLPKSQAKIDRLTFLSRAAAQFRYFKDAWRNHVAHAHQHYDEKSALPVWTGVRDFMQTLAEGGAST